MLLWYWRGESANLDPTAGDYSIDPAALTSTVNLTPAISATAAKIGSNGVLWDSASDQYRFFDNKIGALVRLVGSVGFWFQYPASFGTGFQHPVNWRGNSSSNGFQFMRVATAGAGGSAGRRFTISSTLGSPGDLEFNFGVTVGNWYFGITRWNQPLNYRGMEVYDTNGALIGSIYDKTTAYNPPAELNGTSSRLTIGEGNGETLTGYCDNIFICDRHDELIQANMFITHVNQWRSWPGSDAPQSFDILQHGGEDHFHAEAKDLKAWF